MPALWGNMANCQSDYQSAILLVAAYLSKGDIPLNVCSVAPNEQQILNMVIFMVLTDPPVRTILKIKDFSGLFTIEWE
jgi:hypothetical protein